MSEATIAARLGDISSNDARRRSRRPAWSSSASSVSPPWRRSSGPWEGHGRPLGRGSARGRKASSSSRPRMTPTSPSRTSSPRCPASAPASWPQVTASSTSRLGIPSPRLIVEQRPALERDLHGPTAVACSLPAGELEHVSRGLTDAGFPVFRATTADELGTVRDRRDIGLAIIDGETDFDTALEMYEHLHGERTVPTLMVVSPRAFDQLRRPPARRRHDGVLHPPI